MPSQCCVETGSQGLRSSPHPRLIGLPLNPMECEIFNPTTVRIVRQQSQVIACPGDPACPVWPGVGYAAASR
jgi:hypothetical protein